MLKKGAKGLITLWKKRWFVMEGYKLYYYKNKDAESLRHPLGYIDCSEVTEVTSPVQKKTSFFSSSDPQFQLVTPTRTYVRNTLIAKDFPPPLVVLRGNNFTNCRNSLPRLQQMRKNGKR